MRGGLLRRRDARCDAFRLDGSAALERLGIENDMLKVGVTHEGALPVLEVVRDNLKHLNAIRAEVVGSAGDMADDPFLTRDSTLLSRPQSSLRRQAMVVSPPAPPLVDLVQVTAQTIGSRTVKDYVPEGSLLISTEN